ncbi:hypothetical protein [Serratia fonticola]|uniref:glycine-rich domain-containing protein n=1 Tax=Serratia fonticola TaxID=47917 RepID=UPI003AB0BCC8
MQKVGSVTDTADQNGEFTNGNVAQGVVPTVLLAEIFNTWQRELVNVVEGSGMTLDPNDYGQILKAINKSVGGGRLLRTSIYTKEGSNQYVSIDGNAATQSQSTQFTALSGTKFVEIECQGGGAGGGGVLADGANPAVAGGGGAGAYGLGHFSSGFSSLLITVGAGGAGGPIGNNYGLPGAGSSAGDLIVAPGGYAGKGGAPTVPPFINGGSAYSDDSTGGNIHQIHGGNGGYGIAIGSLNAAGGAGGTSKFGAGAPNTSNRPGFPARNYGAGGAGAGAYSTESSGFAGGDGYPGIVIIREYS